MYTEIEEYAFIECEALEAIIIPKGSFEFYEKEFRKSHLEQFIDLLNEQDLTNSMFVSNWDLRHSFMNSVRVRFSSDKQRLLKASESLIEYEMPEGTRTLCSNESLQKLFLRSSVKNIGAGAFGACSNLLELHFFGELDFIGEFVFWKCSALRKIFIPTGSRTKFSSLLSAGGNSDIIELLEEV